VAELLSSSWPPQFKGDAYRAAVKASTDHIAGKKSADDVRKAFIEAAKEAEIFLWEGKRGGWIYER